MNVATAFTAMRDVELIRELDPQQERFEVLKELSEWQRVIYSTRKIPIMLTAPREGIIASTSSLVKDKGGAIVILRTLNDDKDLNNWSITKDLLPKQSKSHVRITMHGFSYFEPINQTSCWLYRLMCTNPHLALMPDSIMTFGAKKSGPMMIKKLRDD